jgi:hypothetical protein
LKEEIVDRPKSFFIYEGEDQSRKRLEFNKKLKEESALTGSMMFMQVVMGGLKD